LKATESKVIGFIVSAADTDNFTDTPFRNKGTFLYYNGGQDTGDYIRWWSEDFNEAFMFDTEEQAMKCVEKISDSTIPEGADWSDNELTQLFPWSGGVKISKTLQVRPIYSPSISHELVREHKLTPTIPFQS
jgi:hypothetical protein